MPLAALAMLVEPEVPQELPFLKAISWQIVDVKRFSFKEMLIQYERGWHYLGVLGPSAEELQFIKQLVDYYGSWLVTIRESR